MYSRYQNRSDQPIQIPEHYGGSAFAPPPSHREPPIKPHPHPVDAARPSPPPKKTPPLPPPAPLSPSTPPSDRVPENADILPPSPQKGFSEVLGGAFPFSHGIGSEELLLLGLILLVAQSGKDPDVILWLALLLFCG